MNKVYATITSIWDGGTEITTKCIYNKKTKEVTDIDMVDGDGLDILEDEYITLEDGTRVDEFIIDSRPSKSMTVYQPQPKDNKIPENRDGVELWSFEVYLNKEECIRDFPDYVIETYKAEDIEDCVAVDIEPDFSEKDIIEHILINKLASIGMDTPANLEVIVQHCYEDVMETADPVNWNDSDVVIAFRRWIEEQSK